MSANDNSSSLKGYADSAGGAIQNAIGSLTGSTADQQHGAARQDKAAAEKDLSHTVGKVGPVAVSGSGGVAQDDQRRTEGSYNQTVGAAKESIGNLIGAEGMKQDGIRQNREGKGMEAEGQLSDLGKGVGDRVQGSLGAGIAGLTGNRAEQERYQNQHDSGKTAQRSVEADLQKQT